MSDTVKVIENVDKLFSEIEVNGETFTSAKAVVVPPRAPQIKQETVKTEAETEVKETTTAQPVEIVKTIENVDELFPEIEVNGETFTSDKTIKSSSPVIHQEIKPVTESSKNVTDNTVSTKQSVGENVKAVELNGTVHNLEDEIAQITAMEVQRNLQKETTERENAEYALQSHIDAEATTRAENDNVLQGYIDELQGNINELQGKLNALKALVPAQASEDNQLADKDFVNSSISTNTSNFIGTFNTLEELEAQTATNNDYAFWKTTDSEGNVLFKRYKYVSDDGTWQYEYDLNNSSFTAEQWSAINSGATSEAIEAIANKQDKLESGVNIKTLNNQSILGEGNIEVQASSLNVTDSTDALADTDSFLSTNTGAVSTGKRHPLSKLWTWIVDKLTAVTSRAWTGSGKETYTLMSLYTDENGFTFENPLVANSDGSPDKPFKIHKRGGEAGTMQAGQLQLDGASNKANYNENLRLNRYSAGSWATIALGGAKGTESGTDENTWCFGATPSADATNPNELVINRNGSSGYSSASFFKDKYGRIGIKAGGSIVSKDNGFSPIAQSFKPDNNANTGYVQLRFPDIWHYNMLSFKVRIAEYGGRLIEVLCYGYTYGDGIWYNTTASTVGSNTTARIRVWFGAGSDGTATVLFHWEDRQVEGYVQVDVFDFSCGYSNRHYDVSQIEIAITPSINWTREDAEHYVDNPLRNTATTNAVVNRGFGNGEFTWYQTDGGFEGENGWASYLISNHGDGSSYYNQTIRMPFWGAPQYYRKQGGGNTPWYTFITTENMGSYIPAKPVEITPLTSIYASSIIYNYKTFKEELGSVKRFTLFFGLKAGSTYCDTNMRQYSFSMPKSEVARVFGVNADDYRSVLPKFRVEVSTLQTGYNNGNTLINIAGGGFYVATNSQTGAVEYYSLGIYYKSFSYNGSYGSETVGDSNNNMVFKVVVTLDS